MVVKLETAGGEAAAEEAQAGAGSPGESEAGVEAGAVAEGVEGHQEDDGGQRTDADEAGKKDEGATAEDLKGLKPETQEKINKRIDKLTAKRREAEEKAEAEAERATAAEARLKELETAQADEDLNRAVTLGVPAGYATKAELDLLESVEALARQEERLEEILASGESTYTENGKDYTMEQVRATLRSVKRQFMQEAPRAEALKRERCAEAERHRKLGRELEAKRAAKPAAVIPKKAPAAAPAGTPIRKPVVSAGGARKGFDGDRVMERGGTREALAEAYEEI